MGSRGTLQVGIMQVLHKHRMDRDLGYSQLPLKKPFVFLLLLFEICVQAFL